MPKKNKVELDIVMRERWDPPAEGESMVKLLSMPNIPKPCHKMAPRTLLGASTWDNMRKACYHAAEDTCEVCGYKPENKRDRQSHEVYSIDYLKGEVVFRRTVCLCTRDHIYPGIHTGRALTLYKKHDIYMGAETVLGGFEHMFKLIHDYNVEHPDEEPIRVYAAAVGFLEQPELTGRMLALIKKYDIKFWREPTEKEGAAKWEDWHMIIGKKTYPTLYADYEAWEKAMEENNAKNNQVIPRSKLDEESDKISEEIEKLLAG